MKKKKRSNKMICSHCGAENRDDALFCSQCGQPISRVCPNCHREVSKDASFCQYCGYALKQDNGAVCPKCQHVNKPGVGYCVQCGTKLNQSATEYRMEYIEKNIEAVDSKIHWSKVLRIFLVFVLVTVFCYIILKSTHGVQVTDMPKNAMVVK
ncbi:hypothetical protein IV49_GL000518 [Kandleria vitulina DSM 20405]|jgi:predicted amidophosphoribosyltransferase|uniref:RanBP2-type domain-containing protein n=2 Tax=Kandleria vitulina TaxID=1630 RepID=A0A0R2HAB9_9FIRM|nr:zinc ribbon domain-containing protein [Kandleria vitulina]KRN49993.1 hypothetical protein IV49_GL000518 [Kandleria vitulina DSM 20405]HAD23136.1 zinc-ribbon domain-containing protein [Kandleria vitulina]HBG67415.1 zinc-ribbon domain-containing protein [Kandleria vitulina]HCY52577.1 zinc-ribbon domain-containing protein [Kandleria vitulina]